MSKYTLGIVAAVSNNKILNENLKKSCLIKEDQTALLEVREARSAAEAYNQGIRHFPDVDLLIFAHQDVYIPKSWHANVVSAVDELNRLDGNWAVLGVFGKTDQGGPVGRLWDSGMGAELGKPFSTPTPIETLDELLLIINPKADLQFDEKLPGFHLFGTDICATAHSQGYQCYAIHAPVIHNSQRVQSLGGDYARAYRYLQRKWRQKLPLNAVCGKITRWGIEYQRIRLGLSYRRYLGRLQKRPAGSDDPISVAKHLGYE
jgi:hypothetical protein